MRARSVLERLRLLHIYASQRIHAHSSSEDSERGAVCQGRMSVGRSPYWTFTTKVAGRTKSKREIERIIVEFVPQPDVATTIRKLPTLRTASPFLPQHKPTSASEMSKSLRPDRAIFTTPEPGAKPVSTVPVPAKRPVVEPATARTRLIVPSRQRVQRAAASLRTRRIGHRTNRRVRRLDDPWRE